MHAERHTRFGKDGAVTRECPNHLVSPWPETSAFYLSAFDGRLFYQHAYLHIAYVVSSIEVYMCQMCIYIYEGMFIKYVLLP